MLERYNGDICPKIQVIIGKIKRANEEWKETWHGDVEMTQFSLSNDIDTYIMNLVENSCASRKWDLTGIACAHAIVCIWHNGLTVESYVHLTICKCMSLIFICFCTIHLTIHLTFCCRKSQCLAI